MRRKIISTREDLYIFFGRIHLYFPPIRNKKPLFLNHKNVYFSNLFRETELTKSLSP